MKLSNNLDEDVLEFNDSVRDSMISYLEKRDLRVDTPTRLLNKSNDFLPLESIEVNL